MDMRQLRTFTEIMKERSYARAAETLNYSVSSLTGHIAALEKEFQVELFAKQGRNIRPTPAGEQFLVFARQMLELYDQTARAMDAWTSTFRLRVLTSESIGMIAMPPVYSAFLKEHPGARLITENGQPRNFLKQLEEHEADVAVGYIWFSRQNEKYDYTLIAREPAVFFCGPEHPLSRRKRLTPANLNHSRFMLTRPDSVYAQRLSELCTRHGLQITMNPFIDSGSTIKQYVKEGRYLSVLPYSIVSRELQEGSLVELSVEGEEITVDVYAVTLHREEPLPGMESFLQAAQEGWPQRAAAK